MTEPVQVERPAGGGLAGAIGPEAVAALLSIVVVVTLIGARFATVSGGAVTATPTPSAAATDLPTRTAPTFDSAAARNLLIINQNLYRLGATLEGQLNPPPGVDTNTVRNTFSNMQPQLDAGAAQATILAGTPTGAPAGNALIAAYAKLAGIIDGIFDANTALSSQAPWQKAATEVVATLKLLPPLDDQLTVLLAGPPPSPSEVASSGPSTAPSPSVVASPSAVPSATAAPATAAPASPTLAPSLPASVPPSVVPTAPPGPNEVLNPGFEQGVGPPWALVLTQTAQATIAPDTTEHAPGGSTASARIDIQDPTPAIAWISLQQRGLKIDAGAYYQVSVALRASATREVVVRIASATGGTLGTGSRRYSIGPGWSVVSFQMTSIYQSDNASIAIDVGASPETVWVDDVSVTRLNSGAP